MVGRTTTAMAPGQIQTDIGAETFRSALLSAQAVRCANLWLATALIANDGAVEIALCCSLNSDTTRWEVEVYYLSFERAVQALHEYEETGNMPEGE